MSGTEIYVPISPGALGSIVLPSSLNDKLLSGNLYAIYELQPSPGGQEPQLLQVGYELAVDVGGSLISESHRYTKEGVLSEKTTTFKNSAAVSGNYSYFTVKKTAYGDYIDSGITLESSVRNANYTFTKYSSSSMSSAITIDAPEIPLDTVMDLTKIFPYQVYGNPVPPEFVAPQIPQVTVTVIENGPGYYLVDYIDPVNDMPVTLSVIPETIDFPVYYQSIDKYNNVIY